jgi:predicted ArsR family transcriptional regulator
MAILRDSKPRTFQQILSEAGFSHNTLRRHLDGLVDRGLIARRKRPRKGPGRPLFTYGMSRGAERAVSALSDPSMGLVVVSFEGLRRFCRREKGGFCKEVRGRCTPVSCPQIVR